MVATEYTDLLAGINLLSYSPIHHSFPELVPISTLTHATPQPINHFPFYILTHYTKRQGNAVTLIVYIIIVIIMHSLIAN